MAEQFVGEPLDESDFELIATARELVIQPQMFPDRHRIGTAMRTSDGTIITGVCVQAEYVKPVGVCAERIAIGQWATGGNMSPVVAIASVRKPRSSEENQDIVVANSCGICREALIDYFPDAFMVVNLAQEGLRKILVTDMLPAKYTSQRREA